MLSNQSLSGCGGASCVRKDCRLTEEDRGGGSGGGVGEKESKLSLPGFTIGLGGIGRGVAGDRG